MKGENWSDIQALLEVNRRRIEYNITLF
jgi:hypothetical protein